MKATWLLSACALLLWPAAAAQPAPRDTTVTEPAMGYAFEVPRGCIVIQGVDGRGAQIPGWFEVDAKGGGPLVMVRTFGPSMFRVLLGDGPLSEPGDTLLSYAKEEALQLCFSGPTPDSIVSVHRYRNAKGAEVFEVLVKNHPGDEKEPNEEDYSTAADTAESSPTEEISAPASIAGPVFIVNLSRPGARLLFEVSPWGCEEGIPAEWKEVARVISRTVRWLKPSTEPR
jgi:hypothetical protein